MKLRILGDTLRLRLAQGEVAELSRRGRVEQTIHFGPGSAGCLVYTLVCDPEVAQVLAEFDGREIVVRIPASQAKAWIDSDAVSIVAEHAIDEHRVLALRIEKDFQCAVPRPGEEDYDGFPHPDAF
jgi:xanthine/CO dehydrogenase XdhC/CoxF family maturation factor